MTYAIYHLSMKAQGMGIARDLRLPVPRHSDGLSGQYSTSQHHRAIQAQRCIVNCVIIAEPWSGAHASVYRVLMIVA